MRRTSLCWCAAAFVDVTEEETLSGLTNPCSKAACVRIDREQRGLEVFDRVVVPEMPPRSVEPEQLIATIDTLGELGRIVRDERERRGIDIRSAARQIGISSYCLSEMELGHGSQGPTSRSVRLVLAWMLDDRSSVLKEAG